MSRRLTIQLVGSVADRQNVRLTDFIEQLNNVKRALWETEIAVSGKTESAIDYQIVGLSRNSPATVVLEAIPHDKRDKVLIPTVIGSFATELKMIKEKGKLATEPELNRLIAIRKIGGKQNSNIEKVRIRVGRSVVTIDEVFNKKLDAILGPDEFAYGAVSGWLEVINLHEGNKFNLYPTIGARRVVGTFHSDLRPLVKEAIGCFVTTAGRLRYKGWSPFPHGISAESIDIHESDNTLPKLSDLRGTFTNVTGDLTSVEFVRRIRDEKTG
jgi:hypothetical protein